LEGAADGRALTPRGTGRALPGPGGDHTEMWFSHFP
jgi:hypothetical protein